MSTRLYLRKVERKPLKGVDMNGGPRKGEADPWLQQSFSPGASVLLSRGLRSPVSAGSGRADREQIINRHIFTATLI